MERLADWLGSMGTEEEHKCDFTGLSGGLVCVFVCIISLKLGAEEGGCQEINRNRKKKSPLKLAPSTQKTRKGTASQGSELLENAALFQTPQKTVWSTTTHTSKA